MFLSIIIPAYNEEKRIGKTLTSVINYLERQIFTYEILVMNDGSHDQTAQVVKIMARKNPHLVLVDNAENHGKGFVVKQGMLMARGELRLFMDADGSTTIEELDKLLSFAWRGYDVIVSSRQAPGATVIVPQNPTRVFLGGVFRWYTRLMVATGVVDTQNGFKLFSRRAAEEIFSRQALDRWAFDVEILAIARLLHFSIREVPIRWLNDENSQMTFKGMLTMALEIVHIRFNLWLGRYDQPSIVSLDSHSFLN